MTQQSAAAHDDQAYISARQRGKTNRSGANAAKVMRSYPPQEDPDAAHPASGRRHHGQPGNFSSPTEFFGGPRDPPRTIRGIRRNPDGNRDTVGYCLTDEYLMRRGGPAGANGGAAEEEAPSYGATAARGGGAARAAAARAAAAKTMHSGNGKYHKDGLVNNCIVTAPEAPYRSGVRQTHQQTGMDAPYFEDTDPRPPRDKNPASGKRHVKSRAKESDIFRNPGPIAEGEDPADYMTQSRFKANRANESKDVLNLYCYSAEDLNEKPQPYKQLGPRKFVAPDMPPAKPPVIKPINTAAKQEHDVLGTGRWGIPEKERPHGLGRGSCRPPRDSANIFAPPRQPKSNDPWASAAGTTGGAGKAKKRPDAVFPESSHIRTKKQPGNGDILRYYDPAVDAAPASGPKRPASRSNIESRPEKEQPSGRARGVYASHGQSSIQLTYQS